MTSNADRYYNLALLRAPFDDVVAATGGIMRADGNGAIVSRDPTPPVLRATRPDGRLGLRKFALVARLGAATVVEFCYLHNLPVGLTLMVPEAPVLSFRSNWETKTRGTDRFEVLLGGERMRFVEVTQGWETDRAAFSQVGAPQAVESADGYGARYSRQRLNRAILADMAERFAPGLAHALRTRAFDEVVAFEAWSSLDLDDDLTRPRTDRFEAEYRAARALGIGRDEAPLEEAAAQAEWMAQIAELGAFSSKVCAALDRAGPDPAKRRAAYDKWMAHPGRPEMFKPHPDWLTSGVDRAGDPAALAYIDAEAALWKTAMEVERRIQQTIWADPAHAERDLAETDVVAARAVGAVKAGRYPDIERAVRGEMAAALAPAGIAFDPGTPILSETDALRAMAGHLVSGVRDFTDRVNADLTSDLRVRPEPLGRP